MKNNFYTLDVFAEEKYTGNQLAVVMVRQKISDSEMQQSFAITFCQALQPKVEACQCKEKMIYQYSLATASRHCKKILKGLCNPGVIFDKYLNIAISYIQ